MFVARLCYKHGMKKFLGLLPILGGLACMNDIYGLTANKKAENEHPGYKSYVRECTRMTGHPFVVCSVSLWKGIEELHLIVEVPEWTPQEIK